MNPAKEPSNLSFSNLPLNNLETQAAEISEDDRLLMARINMLKPFLSNEEKLAAGLHAYWMIDNSHAQLCELKLKHGEPSPGLRSVIDLIRLVSPQSKAEFALDVLLENFEIRDLNNEI